MMVTVISQPSVQEPQRETSTHHQAVKDNSFTVTTKPRDRKVCSRYLSHSPSMAAKTTSNCSSTSKPGSKRSQSVDRRRFNGVNATEWSGDSKMLITSTRSLSVAFQGEAFSLPISKTKAQEVSTLTRRRATPVRDHGENSKPVDRHRWPGKTREGNLDSGSGSNPFPRSLAFSCDLSASGTDSVYVSSESTTSSMQECGGIGLPKGRSVPRNIGVSARFWQETNSRIRRLQDPGSPSSTSPGSRLGGSAKLSQSKRFSSDGHGAMSSLRGGSMLASPSKLWASSVSSPSRGLSPAWMRNAVGDQMIGNSINTPLIPIYSADIRRGKNGEDRIVDSRVLRLLYNRYLQCRFANAKADATFMVQKLSVEKYLLNAWMRTSELRHSVTLKRIKLLLLRRKLKSTSILKGQIAHLEAWTLLERDHSSSLLGATEALKASTLRLPIVGKAIADIQNLKDAVSSAGDVMQAATSSIFTLSSKVEEMNSLVVKLTRETTKERVLLELCKDFLSTLAAIQVKDCSLRTHIIQLNHVLSSTRKA